MGLVVVIIVLSIVVSYQLMGPMYEPNIVVSAKPLDAYTLFTLDLLERMDFGKKNNVVSPLSIYIALLMLTEGSSGVTKEELLNVLHLASLYESRTWFNNLLKDILDVEKPAKVSIANSVWVQEGFRVNHDYIDVLKKYYIAEAKFVDFQNMPVQAAKAVNEWVENKTYGLIKEIIDPGSIDEMTRILLVNTVYFYANWVWPFKETLQGKFYSDKGEVSIKYMRGDMTIYLLDTSKYLAVALNYWGTDVKFIVIMPKDGDLERFTNGLSKDKLLKIFSDLLSSKQVFVDLYIPKFDIDSGVISLKRILQDMGIEAVFDPDKADLSFMIKSIEKVLYVKDVLHRARVRISLKGTEAAAATAVIVMERAMPSIKIVKIDRPFIFFLVEPDNYAILFAGSIVDPSSLK